MLGRKLNYVRFFSAINQVDQMPQIIPSQFKSFFRNMSENQYEQQQDQNFRFFPSQTQLQQHEINQIENIYCGFMNFLIEPLQIAQFQSKQEEYKNSLYDSIYKNIQIDRKLFDKVYDLKYQLQKNQIYLQKCQENNQTTQQENLNYIKHLGYLNVKGIDQDRQNNQFIHQYKIEKNQNEVDISERSEKLLEELKNEQDQDKELIQKQKDKLKSLKERKEQKKLEAQQEFMDQFKEQRDSAVRKQLKNIFGKFGYEYGKNDNELFEVPDIKGEIQNYKKKALNMVDSKENYLLIEDFMIFSNIQLQFIQREQKNAQNNLNETSLKQKIFNSVVKDSQQQKGSVIFQENANQQNKDQSDNKNSFFYCHFIRTSMPVNSKDAPSVRRNIQKQIIDFDCILFGNPPIDAKRFDL